MMDLEQHQHQAASKMITTKTQVTLLIVFLLGTRLLSCAQTSPFQNVQVDSIRINNQELIAIIDSFIAGEKKCQYYSDSLLIAVTLYKENELDTTSIIILESLVDKNVMIRLGPTGGLFYHKHPIFVYGVFYYDLFIRTEKSITYNLKEMNAIVDYGGNVIIQKEDDRFSSIMYSYDGTTFVCIDSMLPCPRCP